MYELSVGSKVFLFGEYQVLHSGKAFLASIEPRFKMQIKPGQGRCVGIPTGSPADRFYQSEKSFFQTWDIEFLDPHQGRGGFGASTAQFALLQGFKTSLSSIKAQAQLFLDYRSLHLEYLEWARIESQVQPSGVDLISQYQGGLSLVDLPAGKIVKSRWPFPQLQILFFATGTKLSTHTHLAQIQNLDVAELSAIYDQIIKALHDQNQEQFLKQVQKYQIQLAEQGWLAPQTQKYLAEIQKLSGVGAAKGCGAMGNDVVAVWVENTMAKTLIAQIKDLGLQFVGDLRSMTEGLFIDQWIPETSNKINLRESEVL